jgi:hypothetical protein
MPFGLLAVCVGMIRKQIQQCIDQEGRSREWRDRREGRRPDRDWVPQLYLFGLPDAKRHSLWGPPPDDPTPCHSCMCNDGALHP